LGKDKEIVKRWECERDGKEIYQEEEPKNAQDKIIYEEKMELYHKFKPLIYDIVSINNQYLISVAPEIDNRIRLLS